MKLEKFGDSYDIVKYSLLRWLAPCGSWVAHPMFTQKVDPADADAFSKFLGVPFLSTQALCSTTDRNAFFSAAASSERHLFLDPNTGLRVPSASRANAPDFVYGTELVTLARSRPGRLTLVFDQSIDRQYAPKEQIETKLAWLAERAVYAATYESHACFVLASATQNVLEEALATLLKQSQLPAARLVRLSKVPQNKTVHPMSCSRG
jgi:hypothetical protein